MLIPRSSIVHPVLRSDRRANILRCFRPVQCIPLSSTTWRISRHMATVKDSIPHVVRTAEDRRDPGAHNAVLSRVELVNRNIRVLRLSLPDGPVRHLPGQYVDLSIPDIPQVGGFTITSPPQTALARSSSPPQPQSSESSSESRPEPELEPPYIELAIQRSPNNPPAAYLYKDPPSILNTTCSIRIGGNFTYPPYSLSRAQFSHITNAIFIAGGVGINPIMSMLSAMDSFGTGRLGGMVSRVRVLYSSRRETSETGTGDGEEILFEKRLERIAKKWEASQKVDYQYTLFETSGARKKEDENHNVQGRKTRHLYRRMTQDDLLDAIGEEGGRKHTLVYVCGLPTMTDRYVKFLRETPGLEENRVHCEKWW